MSAVLAINAGSSTIKVGLFDMNSQALLARGAVKGLGTAPCLRLQDASGKSCAERLSPTSASVDTWGALLAVVEKHLGQTVLSAVGHRVVHGGRDFAKPILVDGPVLDRLDALTALAPLHQQRSLDPIRALRSLRPGLPQVACFDTSFHHALAPPVSRYALPRHYEDAGVRKYGFHGLSYESIAGQLAELSSQLSSGRTIIAHLGNGASLCAMRDGLSVDTTMGFSTMDGLVMGTRCGALDPAVVVYLQKQFGQSAESVEEILYKQSGLLGVSGISDDMRVLLSSTEPRAHEAIDLFCFRVAREAAAMTNTLVGLDCLVFTGGIGEHAPQIRANICDRLGWLGVEIEPVANARGETDITGPSSRVRVLMLATDEEAVIARHTARLSRGNILPQQGQHCGEELNPVQGER